MLAVLWFTESDYHFGIYEPFLQIYYVYAYNYTTVNANICNTIIVVGVRNTERHIVDNIMVDLEQFNADYDIGDIGDIVDSSAEELEQPTGEYDIGDIVDSSAEELEQPNAEYEIGDIVDSHTVEMEQFAQYDITPHIGK